ncbi:unnamed protein product [Medioppia subpectinata]|uniref:Nucleoside phosphorylase domain-containing protein n=1 Tax=Medioppia subpectinata TaxID=1979941 RepID=A0A7R9Q6B1_9ACAR|nr:unnamed protein product [Medioppia subpectinata]CAG2113076.1 unnamed protein product [Medioppia subpectinata]
MIQNRASVVSIVFHSNDGSLIIQNPHLKSLSSDNLYHLALGTESHDLPVLFGDVKFVCVGGTNQRMKSFAQYMANQLNIEFDNKDWTKASHRYSMFKVGPVLSVTHGMGISSLSILLHELIKLVYYAKCKNVVFMRIGTCGGIGVEQGTVVITEKAVDGLLRPFSELYILGKVVRRPSICDQELVSELKFIAAEDMVDIPTASGTTLCALDFYESQARLDGAFCDITAQEKVDYLNQLKAAGVVNIEMEAITFASMCRSAGISGAIICVALLNRLNGDQIASTKEYLDELQTRPQMLAAKFIRKRLAEYKTQK